MRAPRLLLRLMGKAFALVALFVVFTAGTAAAQTCYVDTGGDDAFDGMTPATANETIAGCLAEAYVGDGDIISVEAGTYSETVTVTEDLIFEARQTGAFTRVNITGELVITADVTVRGNTEGFADGVFRVSDGGGVEAIDVADGASLSIEDPVADGRLQVPSGDLVEVEDEASVSGQITYLGVVDLSYVDGDASNTNVTAGGEFPVGGDFAGGMLSVALGGAVENTLTFDSATDLAALTVGAGTELVGDVIVNDIDLDITGPGNVGNLDINGDGDVDILTDVEVTDVNIASDDDIDFDLGTNMLTVNGDFVRLGGTFSSGAGAELAFRGDGTDNIFTAGPNFEVEVVTVDKDGGSLDITEDITVTEAGALAFSVATGTTVDFANQQVNVDAAGFVDIDGTITNLSTIVFRAPGADVRGDGIYGDILVITGGGDITVGAAAEEDVRFSGTLTLQTGGITIVDGSDDLSPTGADAAVSVNLATAGQDIGGAGTFNALDTSYDLTYTGDMGDAVRVVGIEFATDDLENVTINAFDGTVDADAAPAGTITGNFTITGDADAADEVTVLLPDEVTIEGSLTVGDNAILDTGLGDADITLEGASNSIVGDVAAPVDLILEDGVTLTGNADDDFSSTVNDVMVADDATVSITNIQAITGMLTTGDGSTLTLTLADEQDVTGPVTLGGTLLTLGSDVDVAGDVTITDGTLAFGGNDLFVGGDFAGSADVAYTSSGGELVLDTAAKTLTAAGETIPRVRVTGVAVTLTGDVVVSDLFAETGAGSVDLAGNDLTLGGALSTDGGTFLDDSGAGMLLFTGGTLTLGADATISTGFTIDEDGTLTLAGGAGGPFDLTVDDGDVTVDGNLALGGQTLAFFAATGDLISAGGSVTGSGAVVIASGNIEPSGNIFSVSNLTVSFAGASDVGVATDGTLRITGTLRLESDLNESDVDDNVTFADGATIIRDGGLLVDAPSFEGDVNLIYDAVATTGNEVAPDGMNIDELTANAAVTYDQDLTVDELLTLGAALIQDAADDELTLAPGATLMLNDGFDLSGAELVTTAFNLTVNTTVDTNLDAQILDFVDLDEITTLTASIAGSELDIDAAVTVNNLVVDEGAVELDAALTITGNLTFDGGVVENSDGANVALIFGGGAAQTFTLMGDWVVNDITVTLDKTGDSVVTLAGPAGSTLDFFTNSMTGDIELIALNGGILETEDDTDVFLYQDATTQGFTRTVAAEEQSHIAGNVTKRLFQGDPFGTFTIPGPTTVQKSARFEFPTGSPNAGDPEYRPLALTFRTSIPTQTDITVNHQDVSPGGIVGLPVADDSGVLIGSYPDFFWLLESTVSLGQAQAFDVELTGTDIALPVVDDDDLRIIRRFDGDETTNEWEVQGSAVNYDNFLVDEDGETTAVVRVTNSTGGLVPQGARFTIGIPTQAPVFTATPPGGALAVDEGEGVTFTFTADPQDLGETVTFSLDGAPAFVTIDPVTGVLTAEPGFTDAGVYTFSVIADDGSQQTAFEVTLTVNEVNRAPVVTPDAVEDQTVAEGATLTIDFDATDVDEGDVITFSLAEEVEGVSIDPETGVLTFTPTFDQVGETFAITVNVSDGTATTAITFNVTVEADVLYGDANLSGTVTALDASVVLQHAAGQTTLTGEAFEAADVSDNGQVTAFDAALILQFVAEIIPCFDADPACEAAGKAGLVASGETAWGQVEVNDQLNMINIPIALTGHVDNVYSIDFTTNVDVALVNFKQVTASLPKDWQMSYSFNKETGVLKLAAAGTSPLSDEAVVANATFEMLDKNAKPVFGGEGFVNENSPVVLAQMVVENLPKEFSLSENYPNPFNPTTSINYALPTKAKVVLEVYDVSGRLVQTLVNQEKEAGRYTVQWDGRNAAGNQVASGLYVYRINAGSFVEAKTMLLVK